MTRTLFWTPCLAILLAHAATLSACQTDSETPNAYFERDDAPGDSGQSCRAGNSCNDSSLLCVDDDGDGPATARCRPACVTSDDDPCGAGSRCIGLGSGSDGACVPAGALGESCSGRCDDGLACIDNGDGNGICQALASEGEGEGEGEGE